MRTNTSADPPATVFADTAFTAVASLVAMPGRALRRAVRSGRRAISVYDRATEMAAPAPTVVRTYCTLCGVGCPAAITVAGSTVLKLEPDRAPRRRSGLREGPRRARDPRERPPDQLTARPHRTQGCDRSGLAPRLVGRGARARRGTDARDPPRVGAAGDRVRAWHGERDRALADGAVGRTPRRRVRLPE